MQTRIQKNTEEYRNTTTTRSRRIQKISEEYRNTTTFSQLQKKGGEEFRTAEGDSKMGGGKIEVNLDSRGEGGAWINWAEEVEEMDPIGWYEYQEVERKPAKAAVKRKPAVKKRQFKIKKETTHPYQMRLGTYLALREGEEGMRRLRKEGIRTEQQLEDRYMKGVLGKPGVCKNSDVDQKFDIDKLGEEAVKKLIRGCRSGPMIESRFYPGTGKTEYYVVLLAMSPVQEVQKKGAEKEESPSDTETEPRTEVSVPGLLFKSAIDLRLESQKMEKSSKKREKKHARAKQQAERRTKGERARRDRQHARREKQLSKKLRNRANNLKKKEESTRQETRVEASAESEQEKPKKANSRKSPINSKVRKVLLRAPFKAGEKIKSNCEGKPEQQKNQSKHGWKAGMREVATEKAPARQCKGKEHSFTQVLNLLKKAMNLMSKEVKEVTTEDFKHQHQLKENGAACRYMVGPIPDCSAGKEVQKGGEEYRIQNSEYRNPSSTIKDVGPDYSADVPDLSNMADVGIFGNILGLTPYSSDGKEVKKGGEECRIQNKEYRNKTSTQAESSSEEEEEEGTKSRTKRFFKRGRSRSLKKRKAKRFVKQDMEMPNLTSNSSSSSSEDESKVKIFPRKASREAPSLTDTSGDEEENSQVKTLATMKGGARQTYQEPITYADQFNLAILKAQERLVLDEPTPGLGNCCSCAFVQQCQRPPVKLFLQSRELTIDHFMQLKENVAKFIQTNSNNPKVQNLRLNFELSQFTLHHEGEGMRKRGWRQYWNDMQKDATKVQGRHWLDCWGDDIWLQAAAWYLNMDVHILWAGDDTQGRIISDIDGNWSPVAGDKPRLYLGYIVNEHYQSLLPLVEDHSRPANLAPLAITTALGDALETLKAKLEEDNQVSFKMQLFSFKDKILPTHFDWLLLQAAVTAQLSQQDSSSTCSKDQVKMQLSTSFSHHHLHINFQENQHIIA